MENRFKYSQKLEVYLLTLPVLLYQDSWTIFPCTTLASYVPSIAAAHSLDKSGITNLSPSIIIYTKPGQHSRHHYYWVGWLPAGITGELVQSLEINLNFFFLLICIIPPVRESHYPHQHMLATTHFAINKTFQLSSLAIITHEAAARSSLNFWMSLSLMMP